MKFGETSGVILGEAVIAAGFPSTSQRNQFKPSITHGFIKGLTQLNDHSIIRSDAGVSPGFSGGALLVQSGLMVGMVTGRINDQKSEPPSSASTWAISSDDLLQVINGFKSEAPEVAVDRQRKWDTFGLEINRDSH